MNLDTLLPLAAALLVFAGAYWYFFVKNSAFKPYAGPPPLSSEKAAAKSVSLYGDSISAASHLENYLTPVWFKNWAVAGSCLADTINAIGEMKAWPQQLVDDHSAVLICRYGRNDAAFNRNLVIFKNLLRLFVQASRDAGKVPVLCSLTHEIFTDKKARERWVQYNDAIREVAGLMGVHFIDVSAIPFDVSELPDRVHPAPSYSERVDMIIAKFLEDHQILPA